MRMPERIWAYERAFEKGEGRWTTECEEVTCTTGVAEYVRADLSEWNAAIEAAIAGVKRGCNYCDCLTEVEALKKQEEGNG